MLTPFTAFRQRCGDHRNNGCAVVSRRMSGGKVYRMNKLTFERASIGQLLITGAALLTMAGGCVAWADPPIVSTPPIVAPGSTTQITGSGLRYRIVVEQGKWDGVKTDQGADLPRQITDGIQSQFVDKLVKSGHFMVLEQDESTDQQPSLDDTANAGATPVRLPGGPMLPPREQRIAGAYIIAPTVIAYGEATPGTKGIGIGSVRFGAEKSQVSLSLNIRITDAQTGVMLDSETAIGKANLKSKSAAAAPGPVVTQQDFEASPAGQAVDSALNAAVRQIAARLSLEPWTALVAAQDDSTGRVIINVGALCGVVAGQVFDVYKAGQDVLDPDTGEVISHGDETKIGSIRVARVEDHASYCDVITGDKFVAKDVVKPAQF